MEAKIIRLIFSSEVRAKAEVAHLFFQGFEAYYWRREPNVYVVEYTLYTQG